MRRLRSQRRTHRGDEMLEHVRRVSTDGQASVRLRRPNGWSRDDFERWVRLGYQRMFWTYELERDGDFARLDTLPGLFASEVDDATA